MANAYCGFVHGAQRFKERSFIVERLARVGYEHGGYAQRVVHNENRRRRVPGRVAASFESVADSAVGERRGIGLLLYEQFARELFDYSAFAVVFYERVVFFGRSFGQWLEPVGVMSCSHFCGPAFHAFGNLVGNAAVECGAVVYGVGEFVVYVGGKVFEHLLAVEHILSDGLLPGDFTSSGFVWKAFSTTLNLSVDIFCLFL